MHGDRVVVRIARIESGGRADGEIVKVLKRAHPTVVGEFHIGRRGQYVVPQDERIHQWIEIPEGMEFPPAGPASRPHRRQGAAMSTTVEELDGMIVNVELLEYPEKGASPVGRVIEILGHPGRFRRGCRDRDPQASPAAPVSARGGGAGAVRAGRRFSRANWRAGAISATWTSSPSTARPRAISTMRCGWTACPTATSRCRSTSPM